MSIAKMCAEEFVKLVTHQQCDAKWKSLKRTYKSISERSMTPPLTIQQQLAVLRTEISTLKRLQSGAHDLPFTWENIPNYDPSVSHISLNRWIRLVEEKAYFSRWDDVATTQFVISKLDGRAREWYLGSEIAYKNWNELKSALRSIFDLDASAIGVLFREAALHSSNKHRTSVTKTKLANSRTRQNQHNCS
jgi:hypothetical protein